MKKQGTTRHLLNVVAFILVFIFVVELVPVTAAELLRGALGDRPYVNTVENSALDFPAEEAAEASESEAYVLGEDASLRDEHTKYYRLSNGAYAAASYEEAVHYLKEDGTWQEIDNRMTECGAGDDGFAGAENR